MPSKPTLGRLALLAAPLLAACPAGAESEFDAFTAREQAIYGDGGTPATSSGGGTSSGGEAGACMVPSPMQADGDYLLALSAKLAPTKPLVFVATVSVGAMGVSMSLQPLRSDDRRTPVGSPIPVGPIAVAADGTFSATFPQVTLPAAANAITGTELVATPAIQGTICAPATTFCGVASGSVTKPIPTSLSGSTFAAVRITDPASYPPVQIDCAGTAAPLM